MVARCGHSNATFGEASEVVQTWVLFTNSPRMPQKGKKTAVQSVVSQVVVHGLGEYITDGLARPVWIIDVLLYSYHEVIVVLISVHGPKLEWVLVWSRDVPCDEIYFDTGVCVHFVAGSFRRLCRTYTRNFKIFRAPCCIQIFNMSVLNIHLAWIWG